MKRIVLLIASLLSLFPNLRAADALAHARRAQSLLGVEVWSEVIRIENTGRSHRYPKKVDALIFELVGVLWFYTDTDGTQSLSTFRGRVAQDKADLGALLRGIDPGFTVWKEMPADERATAAAFAERGPLLNGCFVESVAAHRARLAAGEPMERPQLLSYYLENGGHLQGHTVLTYETATEVRVVDPVEPDRVQTFSRSLGASARTLASALFGATITKAVWLGLEWASPLGAAVAGAGQRSKAE